MNDLSVQILITSIRSLGKRGGVIFAGVTDDEDHFVVVCDHTLVPDSSVVNKGQRWSVRGALEMRHFERNGSHHKEEQIRAAEAELLRPAGRNIIAWIANFPDCAGIGKVKAGKLYRRFGLALVDHIDQRNIGALTEVVSEEAADLLCHAFAKHKVADTLLWLDRLGVQRRIGQKIATYYKDQAQAKIEVDPYVLTSFEVKWNVVDDLARSRFNVAEDDARRSVQGERDCRYPLLTRTSVNHRH